MLICPLEKTDTELDEDNFKAFEREALPHPQRCNGGYAVEMIPELLS